jgi:hypothetical protein
MNGKGGDKNRSGADARDEAKDERSELADGFTHHLKNAPFFRNVHGKMWTGAIALLGLMVAGFVYNNMDKPKIVVILVAVVLTLAVWGAAFWVIRCLDTSIKNPDSESAPATQPSATRSPATTQSAIRQLPDGRTVVGVAPEYLLGFFADNLQLRGQTLAGPFLGKWMMVSGKVEDVAILCGQYGITFKGYTSPMKLLTMLFSDEWGNRLQLLKKGDEVTVLGQIVIIRKYVLTLGACEIVRC